MASVKMACRVCGKEYEPCRTANRRPNVFHWQEVACSPECGTIYLQRIIESRNPSGEPLDDTGSVGRGKRNKKNPAARIETGPATSKPSTASAEAVPAEFVPGAPEEFE